MSVQANTPLDTAIRAMGGVASTVRRLGLGGHATVYQWRKNRVPSDYCPRIEEATGGLVRCEDLRPDVRWDVLRNTPKTLPGGAATRADIGHNAIKNEAKEAAHV